MALWSLSAAAPASAQLPPGMPSDVPVAASTPAPTLPEPSSAAWPFANTFPQTSGTGRLAGGASLWTDFIYDDYGAADPLGLPDSTYYWLSGLLARDNSYGTIATIQAADAALRDSSVTDQRFGPSLVTQPIPGTETGLSWKLGPRHAGR